MNHAKRSSKGVACCILLTPLFNAIKIHYREEGGRMESGRGGKAEGFILGD